MSASEKLDLTRGARLAEKLFDEETDRLAEMSDADFERAMDALPAPARVPSAEELVARAKQLADERAAPGKVAVLPMRPTRSARRHGFGTRRAVVLWLVAATLGVGLVVLVVERGAVVALFRAPEAPIGPDPVTAPPPPRELTGVERAEKLRDEAAAACESGLYGRCSTKLDEAKELDPAGEDGERTKMLRAKIVKDTTLPKDWDPKGTRGKR